MAQIPTAFLALFTRIQLAEMLTSTYAKARGIDPNDAYVRLEESLHTWKLIDGVQRGLWHAFNEQKPDLGEEKLIALAERRVSKRKTYKPLSSTSRNEGPLAALTILIDEGAGVSSGEASGLLDTEEGERMLEAGFDLIGAHLAAQLTR